MDRPPGPAHLVTALVLGIVAALLVPGSALAAGAVSTTGTDVVSVRPSSTTALTGLSVSDTDSTDTLQVNLSTDLGTISLGTSTGLTLDYGYTTFSGAAISFTGSPSDVNAAVGTATLTTTSTIGTAHVSLSAMVSSPGYVYSPTNGHFYHFVSNTNVTWTAAQTAAAALSFNGQPGYLGTMSTAATNDVVANRIPGAINAWIGAKSTDTPGGTIKRTWRWDDGPVAGQVISYCSNVSGQCDFTNNTGLYSSWDTGEPNNTGNNGSAYSGEWTAVTNWLGTHGAWNDIPGTSTTNVSGYIVEYGDRVNGSSGFTGVSSSASSVRVSSAPGAPTGVSAVRGDQQVTVSFTAPAANGSPVTGYAVTSSPGGAVGTCTASPCTVTGLNNGTAYTFTVTATNEAGTSPASSAIPAVTPAGIPAAPTGLTATRSDHQATVTFSDGSSNGSALTGYLVRAFSGGVAALSSSCSAQPCTVTGLANGTAYTFTVRSINTVGTSLASDPSDAVTPAGVPAAPTGVSAVRGNTAAQVSFTAPSADGSPITGYPVTSAPGGVTGTCAASPCTVSGLTNGTAYTFTVRATNAVGTSVSSSGSTAVTPAAVPDAPSGVSAVLGDQQAVVSFGLPAAGGDVITGYSVRAVTGGVATTTSCADSPCTVTGLTNGSAYTFTVKAINAVGSSPASDPSDAVTPAAPTPAPTVPPTVPPTVAPGPPGAVAVEGSDRALNLRFTAPTDPGSSPVTSFEVRTGAGWNPLPTSGAGHLTATVAPVRNGRSYDVQVRAVNAVGPGAAGAVTTVRVAAWYVDPVSAQRRRAEVKVPREPALYTGRPRHTVATSRSARGQAVTSLTALRARQLQAGQGTQILVRRLFAPGSTRLTARGRSRLRTLAGSLTWVQGIGCEGYTDYADPTDSTDSTDPTDSTTPMASAQKVSTAQARRVCAALGRAGVHAKRVSRGYGDTRPQVVGGLAQGRVANNRVVVMVTRG